MVANLWDKEIPTTTTRHTILRYSFYEKETADYSVLLQHGVYLSLDEEGANLILIRCIKGRYEFPELRSIALNNTMDIGNLKSVIIESKASGLPLTYELRKMDIPVVNFTPSKGNDKHTRVNAVAPLFESGMIWAPKKIC